MECDAIVEALLDARGNKVEAARRLAMSRATIYRKIRDYGISVPITAEPDLAEPRSARHATTARRPGRSAGPSSSAVWLVALAVAGEPVWLAVLLGVALVLVWASPFLLATNRHPRPARDGPPGRRAGARPPVLLNRSRVRPRGCGDVTVCCDVATGNLGGQRRGVAPNVAVDILTDAGSPADVRPRGPAPARRARPSTRQHAAGSRSCALSRPDQRGPTRPWTPSSSARSSPSASSSSPSWATSPSSWR